MLGCSGQTRRLNSVWSGGDLFGVSEMRDEDEEGDGWRVRTADELAELRRRKLMPDDAFGLSQMQEKEWEDTAAVTRNVRNAPAAAEPPSPRPKSMLEKISDAMAKTLEGAAALAKHDSSGQASDASNGKAEEKEKEPSGRERRLMASALATIEAYAQPEEPKSPGGFHGGFPPPPPRVQKPPTPPSPDRAAEAAKKDAEAAVAAEKFAQAAVAASAAATKKRLEALAVRLKAETAQQNAHMKAKAAAEAKRKSDESEAARATAAAAAAAMASAQPAPPVGDDDLSCDYYSSDEDAGKENATKTQTAAVVAKVAVAQPATPIKAGSLADRLGAEDSDYGYYSDEADESEV